MGAQRRIEARIGQLFGEPRTGSELGRGKVLTVMSTFHPHLIREFRLMAAGVDSMTLIPPRRRQGYRSSHAPAFAALGAS